MNAKAQSGESLSISLPSKVVVPLLMALFAAIGSPWAARFFSDEAKGLGGTSQLPQIQLDVESLKQSRDYTDRQLMGLVEQQKETNRLINQLRSELVTGLFGWPNGRPPAGVNP